MRTKVLRCEFCLYRFRLWKMLSFCVFLTALPTLVHVHDITTECYSVYSTFQNTFSWFLLFTVGLKTRVCHVSKIRRKVLSILRNREPKQFCTKHSKVLPMFVLKKQTWCKKWMRFQNRRTTCKNVISAHYGIVRALCKLGKPRA